MIKKLLFSALILSVLNSNSQVVPNIDWVENFSEKSQIANFPSAIDANNNAYITGYTYPNSPANQDATTIKYAPTGGAPLWVANYDFGGVDNAKAIILDLASNVYITGESDGIGAGRDLFVVKYDQNGNQIFSYRYNGAANGNDVGNAITVDPSGNIFITGYTTNMGGFKDYISIKLNNAGIQQFAVVFNGTGNLNDEAIAIAFNNNRLYVTGNATNLSGNTDIVTLRLNANNGNTMWSQTINGTTNSNDIVNAVLAYNNDIVIVGQVANVGTNNDYITTRYNGNNGSIQWQKVYDNSNSNGGATALVADASGNFAVTGVVNNSGIYEYHTLLYNNTGIFQWVNKVSTGLTYVSANPQIAVDQVANHFYVCGQKLGTQSDIYVYQITPSGNKTWEEQFNGNMNGQDAAVDLVVNSSGQIYIAGASLNSNAKFDYTTIKISQTPVYFPMDPTNEPLASDKLFFKNEGQLIDQNYNLVPKVLYYNNSTGPEYYVQKDMVSYVFKRADTLVSTVDSLERIDVQFLKSNQLTKFYDFEPSGVKLNYFLTHCGSDGITDINGNKKLFVPNIYPGIDLHYSSNTNGIKYFFVVKPNVDPKQIEILISGAQSSGITSGNLKLNGVLGSVDFGTIQAYQPVSATITTPVSSSWQTIATSKYGISVPSYNTALPLILKISLPNTPPVSTGPIQNLNYSTFYGSTSNEGFTAIRVKDNTNNRYIIGYTISNNFPTLFGLFPYSASDDAVLLKYSGGDSLKFATFYGGTGYDNPTGVAVKSNGNIYLVGNTTSLNLPIKTVIRTTADQQILNGQSTSSLISNQDAFILELSDNGVQVSHKWSRYLGGAGGDGINDIALDRNDNLYLVGSSASCNYPLKNTIKAAPSQCQFGTNADMVFTKMDSTCKIVWSTFFGGDNTILNTLNNLYENKDIAYACDVDTLGQLYIAGSIYASSDKAPLNLTSNTTTTSIFNPISDGNGGVILRLASPSNTPIVQMYTEVGISNTQINDIKVMPDQTVLMCGNTIDAISNFPLKIKNGSYNRAIPGPNVRRGFFSWLDTDMTNLWTTHFNKQQPTANLSLGRIAISDNGSFYLAGILQGDSLTYPATTPANVYIKNNSVGQNQEAFISYFSNAITGFQLKHTHYLGGTGNDWGYDIDVYQNSALYITGQTTTSDFPVAFTASNAALVDVTFNGGFYDGFITRFDLSPVIISVKETTKNNFLTVTSYPNPVSDIFYINTKEIKDSKPTTIEVYNLNGQLIYKNNFSKFNEDLLEVNCSDWTSGMYIITISKENSRYSSKVIKQ
jgi:hypothetical protein